MPTKVASQPRRTRRDRRRVLENSENFRVWTRGPRLLVAHKHSKAKASCRLLRGHHPRNARERQHMATAIEILRADVEAILKESGTPVSANSSPS